MDLKCPCGQPPLIFKIVPCTETHPEPAPYKPLHSDEQPEKEAGRRRTGTRKDPAGHNTATSENKEKPSTPTGRGNTATRRRPRRPEDPGLRSSERHWWYKPGCAFKLKKCLSSGTACTASACGVRPRRPRYESPCHWCCSRCPFAAPWNPPESPRRRSPGRSVPKLEVIAVGGTRCRRRGDPARGQRRCKQ